jgi:hypothetical protein
MYGPEWAVARRARRSGGIDICKIGDKYEGPADGAQEADWTFEGVKGLRIYRHVSPTQTTIPSLLRPFGILRRRENDSKFRPRPIPNIELYSEERTNWTRVQFCFLLKNTSYNYPAFWIWLSQTR